MSNNINTLNIIQWNEQFVVHKFNEYTLNKNRIHIVIIQETWLSQNKNISIHTKI